MYKGQRGSYKKIWPFERSKKHVKLLGHVTCTDWQAGSSGIHWTPWGCSSRREVQLYSSLDNRFKAAGCVVWQLSIHINYWFRLISIPSKFLVVFYSSTALERSVWFRCATHDWFFRYFFEGSADETVLRCDSRTVSGNRRLTRKPVNRRRFSP
jgi:hypothetical protein